MSMADVLTNQMNGLFALNQPIRKMNKLLKNQGDQEKYTKMMYQEELRDAYSYPHVNVPPMVAMCQSIMEKDRETRNMLRAKIREAVLQQADRYTVDEHNQPYNMKLNPIAKFKITEMLSNMITKGLNFLRGRKDNDDNIIELANDFQSFSQYLENFGSQIKHDRTYKLEFDKRISTLQDIFVKIKDAMIKVNRINLSAGEPPKFDDYYNVLVERIDKNLNDLLRFGHVVDNNGSFGDVVIANPNNVEVSAEVPENVVMNERNRISKNRFDKIVLDKEEEKQNKRDKILEEQLNELQQINRSNADRNYSARMERERGRREPDIDLTVPLLGYDEDTLLGYDEDENEVNDYFHSDFKDEDEIEVENTVNSLSIFNELRELDENKDHNNMNGNFKDNMDNFKNIISENLASIIGTYIDKNITSDGIKSFLDNYVSSSGAKDGWKQSKIFYNKYKKYELLQPIVTKGKMFNDLSNYLKLNKTQKTKLSQGFQDIGLMAM